MNPTGHLGERLGSSRVRRSGPHHDVAPPKGPFTGLVLELKVSLGLVDSHLCGGK
jgi:hypothetical protein